MTQTEIKWLTRELYRQGANKNQIENFITTIDWVRTFGKEGEVTRAS